MKLRDALLDALKGVPGTRTFHLHVLRSTAKKHFGLFPFAVPRPKTYMQDILILLSEEKEKENANANSQRVFVSGIEAVVYTIPSTSTSVLYISKIDSTGQGVAPSPTSRLVSAFLTYYTNRGTSPLAESDTLWIHVFARAQGQYLFPNSVEWGGKRVLSDVKLCWWWKKVLSGVAGETRRGNEGARVRGYYVLPGYTEMEAEQSLRFGEVEEEWVYGHPYGQRDIRLPCGRGDGGNLGCFVPSFEDDPKSRFMDEIAYTTKADVIESPRKKRQKTNDGKRREVEDEERPLGELSRVSVDEFWERMSFRQECVAGAVTGFFVVGFGFKEKGRGEEEGGEVTLQVIKRVTTLLTTGVEFSDVERAVRGTETVEKEIRGLSEDGEQSLDKYQSHIYGTVKVANAGVGKVGVGSGSVRELVVRRKRKDR